MKKILAALALIVLASPSLLQPLAAQQGGTTRFLYDKNGRLHIVALPDGQGASYDYDPAGNITSIQRFAAGTFTVQISPTTAQVTQGSSAQFSAVVPSQLGSPEIVWSVNGEVGGDDFVGTISPTGLYTAPGFFRFSMTVRAASAVAPNFYAEATVFMRDASSNPGLVSPMITVGRSLTDSLRAPAAAPRISAVAPGRLNHQSATRLTVRGTDLSGATGLRFLDARGEVDSAILVTEFRVNPAGTELTALVKTAKRTATGRRVVVVTKPGASSATGADSANTVEVAAR